MRTLRIGLEYYVPWTNDIGYQIAIERGWYREVGIDLRQVLPDPFLGDTLEHLARGEVDVAVFPTNRLFVRHEAGEPLLAVAAINHRAMETILTLAGNGIERPRDLGGRRVAFNPTPRGVAMVRHLIAADGGDADSIEIIDSGSREVNAEDLKDGLADAFFGAYWAWDALFGNVPDDERVAWPVDEIGAPPYHSYLLGVRAAFAEDESELITAFLSATERGFRAAAEDPELALAVARQAIPYVRPELIARSLAVLPGSWFHDGVWGRNRSELHEPYAEWLAAHGILSDSNVWTRATTNAFLPPAGSIT
jgi:putative hydroxymethylpyrimidine transport system substrate-binding protein